MHYPPPDPDTATLRGIEHPHDHKWGAWMRVARGTGGYDFYVRQCLETAGCPATREARMTPTGPGVREREARAAHSAWEQHRWKQMVRWGGAPPAIPTGALDVILSAAYEARMEIAHG